MLETIGPWISDEVARRAGLAPATARALVPPAIVLVAFALGLTAEWILVRALRSAEGTKTRLDDVIARALRGPIRVFSVLIGVGLALLVVDLPAGARGWVRGILGFVLGIALVVIAARLLASLVDTYGDKARLEGPSRNLARRLSTLAVWSLGILIVLQQQGINVTPLLTTLGLAGLAVALAFQDTLSNLFAGVYIQADRPLDIGHYVRFEEHALEGFVVEVGWRTTKIRTLGNNLVVIPNARVASSIVTDYTLPEPRMSLLVRIPVSPDANAAQVESLVMEEALKAAGTIPGFLKEPAPFVRFIPGFTESGLEFTLICQVETFVDQYAVQHELRHRIDQRLRAEGLSPSVPHRTIRLTEDAASRASTPGTPSKPGTSSKPSTPAP